MSVVRKHTLFKRALFAGLAGAIALSGIAAWASEQRFPSSGEYGVLTYYQDGQIVGQQVISMCPPDISPPASWGTTAPQYTYYISNCGG